MSLFAALAPQVGSSWSFQSRHSKLKITASALRAPHLWNDLPEEIRLAESVTSFNSLYKTHIYIL